MKQVLDDNHLNQEIKHLLIRFLAKTLKIIKIESFLAMKKVISLFRIKNISLGKIELIVIIKLISPME